MSTPQFEFIAHGLTFLASALPLVLFASPVTVFWEQRKQNDDVKGGITMPPLALTSQAAQCLLFLLYSLCSLNLPGIVANFGGFLLGVVFLSMYPFFLGQDSEEDDDNRSGTKQYRSTYRKHVCALILVGGGFLTGFFLAPYSSITTEDSNSQGGVLLIDLLKNTLHIESLPSIDSLYAQILKYTALVFGLLLFLHPLFVFSKVIQTKDPSLMGSSMMNYAAFLCCLAWVFFSSLVKFDIVFLLQNSVGLVVNVGAILLRWRLGSPGGSTLSESLISGSVQSTSDDLKRTVSTDADHIMEMSSTATSSEVELQSAA